MKQQTLAMAAGQGEGFEQHRRATRRDVFLSTMEQIVPWSALCAVIEPYYAHSLRGFFCTQAVLDDTAHQQLSTVDG